MTLREIRKEYIGCRLVPDNLDVWNFHANESGEVFFHFEDGDYTISVKMVVDERNVIRTIAPIKCERLIWESERSSEFRNTRATEDRYDALGMVLLPATEYIEDED